jgi:hypothetical protein
MPLENIFFVLKWDHSPILKKNKLQNNKEKPRKLDIHGKKSKCLEHLMFL